MSNKHTPGPWHSLNGMAITKARTGMEIARMTDTGRRDANARLIAAAPEMADLLNSLQRYLPVHQQDKVRALLGRTESDS